MSRRLPLVLTLSLLSLAFAGCIEVPGVDGPANETSGDAPSVRDAGGDARMSATEQKTESSGACKEGYCITQTVRVTGSIQDLSSLEATLRTVNGAIRITGGADGSWSMVATLASKAPTQAGAQAAMNDLRFTWSHQSGESHFLEAEAEFRSRHEDAQRSAGIEVVMPRSLLLRVVADTTNGGIAVSGVRTDGLSAHTTNGGIDVDADVAQVGLGTTNGGIDANLRPTASGRIQLGSTNGRIELTLPEDEQRGYDLEASTTNGEVSIGLRDGDLGPCPQGSQYYTPPCNHRTFKTRGYDARAIRSQVSAGTTNGSVTVEAA